MQTQSCRVVFTFLVAAVFLASLSIPAVANTEGARAAFAAAAKQDTNVPGVRIFVGPPQGFNPLTASNDDLAKYGLPQRPDKASDPARYAIWERGMMAAKHRANGHVVAKPYSSTNLKPGKTAGTDGAEAGPAPATSFNWSGVASVNANKNWKNTTSFDLVESVFNVPVAQPPFGACSNGITGPFYEVSWNGIDGFNNGDVVQGGSFSAADCLGDTEYFSWVEWYPSYPVLEVFGSNPGDDIWVQTFGAPGTSSQFVFVEDITLQTFGTFELVYQSGPGLVGSSAEWIVERPGVNGGLAALANTIYDFFNYDFAENGKGQTFYAGSTSNKTYNISMLADDGSTVIETVNSGPNDGQGKLSLWFVTQNCAYSGGCTP